MTALEDDATARAFFAAYLHDRAAYMAEHFPLLVEAAATERIAWERHEEMTELTMRSFWQWADSNALSAGCALHGRGTWAAYRQAKEELAAVERWLAARGCSKGGIGDR
ncbi:hypothetical protein ACH4E8_34470 [Streptomyces sp. NPDC017979]|uniref:hypothetical protein n=1 Tax=Streptomyces sp. NPDC017979 TaxID=3365024 RepID=UPI0037BE07B8